MIIKILLIVISINNFLLKINYSYKLISLVEKLLESISRVMISFNKLLKLEIQ